MTTKTSTVRHFSSLLKREISENSRTLLLTLALMFGSMTVFELFIVHTHRHTMFYGDPAYDITASATGSMMFIMLMVFACKCGAMMMRDTVSRGGRIRFFMLPAPQGAKFAARWMIHVPLFFVAFTACAAMAEIIRVGYAHLVVNVNCVSYLSWLMYDSIFPDEVSNIIMAAVLIQSFFILGSTIWPRNSFMKTFAALFAMSTISIIFVAIVSLQFANKAMSITAEHSIEPSSMALNLSMAAGIIVNTLLAYWRMRDTDLT